jgi:hypothetical protein
VTGSSRRSPPDADRIPTEKLEGDGGIDSSPDLDSGSLLIGWRGFWLASAIRHLFSLKVCHTIDSTRSSHSCLAQINHKSVLLSIPDREERGMLVFAWWFACLCDSYASTYHRRMPIIKDDDYDVDFYTAEPLSEDANRANQGPREHLEV